MKINLRTVCERIAGARSELSAGRYVQAAQALDVLLSELRAAVVAQAYSRQRGAQKRAARKVLRSMLKAVQ